MLKGSRRKEESRVMRVVLKKGRVGLKKEEFD